MGRALLLPLLLYALSSTVLATGLSDDFVPCAVAGDGDAYGSVEPHSEFSGGFMSRFTLERYEATSVTGLGIPESIIFLKPEILVASEHFPGRWPGCGRRHW